MSAAWPERPFLHRQARALLAQLQRLAAQAPGEQQPLWSRHQQHLEELAQLLESSETKPIAHPIGSVVSLAQWIDFGQRLRDKRNAAGLSRQQLARRAKLSDATVKFLETARHPPSRSTLIRPIGVPVPVIPQEECRSDESAFGETNSRGIGQGISGRIGRGLSRLVIHAHERRGQTWSQ